MAEFGTLEQTNELVNQGKALGLDLEKYRVPTSVGSITPVESPTLPQTSPKMPDLSGVKGRVDFYKTSAAFYMKEAERLDAEKAKQNETALSKAASGAEAAAIDRVTDPSLNPATIRREAEEITGINPREYFAKRQAATAELATLNNEFEKTKAERDAAIEARRAQGGGLVSGTDTAVTKIERDYATKLNQQASIIKAKAALAEVEQGNFKEAQDFIKDAVTDATADTRYTLDLFNTFYNKNQDQIEKLDSKYSDALKNALSSAEEAYESEYSEMLKVGELMIDPDYKGAGITLKDKLEAAFSKISRGIANGSIGDGGGSSGFLDSKVEADVRATIYGDGGSMDRITTGTSTPEKEYTRLRGLYSPREVGDETLRSLLGITAAEEVATGPKSLAEDRAAKLEEDISRLSISGVLRKSDIKASLRNFGYSQKEIANSSAGNLIDSIQAFIFRE